MVDPLSNQIIGRIKQALELYHRLVLVVAPSGSGKTSALREVQQSLGAPLILEDPTIQKDLGLLKAKDRKHLKAFIKTQTLPEDLGHDFIHAVREVLSGLVKVEVKIENLRSALRNGRLTRAGLFLAGKETSIRDHVPGYVWTHLRMASDTQYTDRMDGSDALPVALQRLTDRIMADNPIATMEYGMFHFEYRTYPEIALREALMNAFCHADFRIAGPILVKQYPDRIEISNPGGFIGGISADNILHHEPVARNPCLVDALARLRLVNRSNLGVGRMFEALLIEGKEPPLIQEQGEAIRIVFVKRDLDPAFRAFAAEESRQGRLLSVDYLLILQYLRLHAEIDTATGARMCQRQEAEVREILSTMERERGYLERGGTGRGTYWTLRTSLDKRIAAGRYGERDRRIDWEAAKTRVLSVLKHRAEHGQPGLSNAEIRQITRFDRNQVFRMMRELQGENPKVSLSGKGRYAKYEYAD